VVARDSPRPFSTAARIPDDSSDDNPGDSCTPNNGYDSPKTFLSCLVTHSAWSWQCGESAVRVLHRYAVSCGFGTVRQVRHANATRTPDDQTPVVPRVCPVGQTQPATPWTQWTRNSC
jgi:hypothetical protein